MAIHSSILVRSALPTPLPDASLRVLFVVVDMVLPSVV
jgi:hypothetical protein